MNLPFLLFLNFSKPNYIFNSFPNYVKHMGIRAGFSLLSGALVTKEKKNEYISFLIIWVVGLAVLEDILGVILILSVSENRLIINCFILQSASEAVRIDVIKNIVN